jgi:hypothetical protein
MRDRDAVWPEPPPAGEFPSRPETARTVSRAAVALGAALLFPVPLGGALLLVAGSLGLVISSEAPVGGPTTG